MNTSKLSLATFVALSLTGTLAAQTWTGAVSSSWSEAGNWNGGQVPTSASSSTALVNNTSGEMPVIDGENAFAHSVTIGQTTGVTAYLTIRNGGALTTLQDSFIGGIFNTAARGVGHVTLTGPTSQWNAQAIRVGLVNGSEGSTLKVLDGATLQGAGLLHVGVGGSASLSVSNSATVTGFTSLSLGNGEGGIGNATISGIGTSVTTSGAIYAGYSGAGVLEIDAGATLSGASLTLGENATGNGRASVSGLGSSLSLSGGLNIGKKGWGELTLEDRAISTVASLAVGADAVSGASRLSVLSGAKLTVNGNASMGAGAAVTSEVVVNGGTIESTGGWNFGNGNGGRVDMTVSNGGRVAIAGASMLSMGNVSGSTGKITVTGQGSSLESGGIRVGHQGSGELVVSDEGVVKVGNGTGTITLANTAGGSGVLSIGDGGKAGVLLAGTISAIGTNAKLVLNHNESAYDLNARIQGTVALEVNGSGETVLNSALANTYTGGTVVNSGTLRIKSGANNWLAATGNIRLAGGRFDLGGNSLTLSTGKLVLDGGELANGTASKSSGNFEASSGTVSAALSGSAGLTKTTSGTLILSGANTYTGATTIEDGTLLVRQGGSLSASSHVTVGDGGTLSGNGVIHGSVTLDGGTLNVGETTGVFTVNGDLVLNNAITFMDIESASVFDTLQGIDTLTYGGSLYINLAEGVESGTFELFSFDTRSGSSIFSDIFFSNGYTGTFDYTTGVLSVVVIPEPSHLALLGFLAMGICRELYRRRISSAPREFCRKG